MYTTDERKQILKKAFWDKKIDLDILNSFINGKIDNILLISSKSIIKNTPQYEELINYGVINA